MNGKRGKNGLQCIIFEQTCKIFIGWFLPRVFMNNTISIRNWMGMDRIINHLCWWKASDFIRKLRNVFKKCTLLFVTKSKHLPFGLASTQQTHLMAQESLLLRELKL